MSDGAFQRRWRPWADRLGIDDASRRRMGDAARAWWADLRTATAFLTRLRVAPEAEALNRSVRAYPLVGAGVGLVAGLALAAGSALGLHPLACGLIALVVAVLLTGALHEDGLADLADGLGGGEDADDSLAIMRDSRVGSFGAIALVLALGLRAALLAGMPGPGAAVLALIAAGAVSRGVLPLVMLHWTTARPDGFAAAVGRPTREVAVAGALLGAGLAVVFAGPAVGLAAALAGGAAGLALAAYAARRLGGYTGDVLGAVQQTAEIAALIAAAALL